MNKIPLKNRLLIRLALGFVGRKGLVELARASKKPEKVQEKVLRSFLEGSKDTVYGKEHRFREILAARGPDFFSLYRKNVPVNDYEDLRPYVDRHKEGEPDVLFPGKPKMYGTTSGTTREPKWIPITERYYQDVYQEMNRLWFYTLIRNKPRVFSGKTLSIVGKAIEGAAPDGTVYGSISGISQRDIPRFMEILHTAPAEVFHIADYKARYYAIMRIGIEQDVTLIITANPSSLVEMVSNANEFYDEYVNDIRQGTLSRNLDISAGIRAILEARLRPNPERAAELEALKAKYGRVLPRHYWPNMQMINVWMCGNTSVYLDKVKDSFPEETFFHEFSYFSTECKAGLVLKSNTMDTVIFGHKTYWEFIHVSDESPEPRIYQLWEVKQGECYYPVITTSAGLYRYNMNDILEISGFYKGFPLIRFIQKGNGIISMTGEKLHERQFIEAVQAAQKDLDLSLAFFVGFADLERSNYQFYYEFTDPGVTRARAEELSARVDGYLKQFNSEYEGKRDSNRIKVPETFFLVPNSFEKFKSACIDLGYRDGQFKLNLLMQDDKRREMFRRLVLKEAAEPG
ncbi:MAG: GH3 auxin-responsive promoter family protein [Treponema sp.]|jgi:hypothetical protein|nr:GH3 auxin-responsive promoter family protein [Treponema sp.]